MNSCSTTISSQTILKENKSSLIDVFPKTVLLLTVRLHDIYDIVGLGRQVQVGPFPQLLSVDIAVLHHLEEHHFGDDGSRDKWLNPKVCFMRFPTGVEGPDSEIGRRYTTVVSTAIPAYVSSNKDGIPRRRFSW